ncbi:hypothetical protein ACFU5Y_05955 [Streptomyces gardneri]|uniref:hypothetical protein n=1 Tax=Streptomyces gardneri TaxID=66892 RepID=UPI00369AC77F
MAARSRRGSTLADPAGPWAARRAETLLISPATHAAVTAAAATLEPAHVGTLDKDRDIPMPAGLLILPEPVILENRGGSLSHIRAFG